MKILFIRHAESIDDLTGQYGGWLDLELTPNGRNQVAAVIADIKQLSEHFDEILTSPLKRAEESAYILGSGLGVPVREFVYLKERNGYGLLSGLTKTEAKQNYPELVADMEAGYVFGSEPEDMLVKRVRKTYEILTSMDKNIVVVTHGGFLSRLFEHVLHLNYIKAHDAGFVLWDTVTLKVTASHSFEFEGEA